MINTTDMIQLYLDVYCINNLAISVIFKSPFYRGSKMIEQLLTNSCMATYGLRPHYSVTN